MNLGQMKQILLTIFAVALFAACSPEIHVRTDFDPDYDLWNYKTFDWGKKVNIEEGLNPLHYNELNDKRIKSAIKSQLTARGYQLSDVNPDLLLHYHIIVTDKSAVTTTPFGYNYSDYWMRTETNIYTYREGTLILDLMDSKTHNLIWRGWAVSALETPYSQEEIDRLIKKVVSKIFKKFPDNRSALPENPDVVSN